MRPRLEAEDDLGSQVAEAIGGCEERLLERDPDGFVTWRDPRRAVVRRHREVEDPRAGAVATDPQLAAIGEQLAWAGQRSESPACVGPDTNRRREVVEHRAKVGAEERDIDVVVAAGATRERVYRPAPAHPPRHRDTVEKRGDSDRGERIPRPVPALVRLVVV